MIPKFDNRIFQKVFPWLVPVVTGLIGLLFTTIGICRYNLSNIPGDFGDARFNMYILEHGYQYIVGQVQHYWNAPFMYPFPNILALSDNLLGTMPIYSFFRIFSCDRETSFQLWFVTISILNFTAAFYILKKLVSDYILASAGAFVYAFSVFLFSQFNHAQVFPRFITPLVIYWIIKYFENYRLKYLCLAVVGVVYQFYCGIYLGFFLGLTSVVLFIILILVNFRSAVKKEAFSAGKLMWKVIIIAGGFVLLLPMIIPYIHMAAIAGQKNFQDAFKTVPLPTSYFFSSHVSYPWRFLSLHGIKDNYAWWDQQIFIGLIPWLAFIIGAFFCFKKSYIRNNKILFSITLSLMCSLLLTTRFGDFSLFKWVFRIPGFTSIGCVPRVMNIYLILFSLELCMITSLLVKTKKEFWFSLLLIGVIVDNMARPLEASSFQKTEAQNRLKPIVNQLQAINWEKKAAFAFVPEQKTNEVEVQLDAMMASQLVHEPCVNGYSSTSPGGFGSFWINYDEPSLYQWLDQNQIDHSSIVIVH